MTYTHSAGYENNLYHYIHHKKRVIIIPVSLVHLRKESQMKFKCLKIGLFAMILVSSWHVSAIGQSYFMSEIRMFDLQDFNRFDRYEITMFEVSGIIGERAAAKELPILGFGSIVYDRGIATKGSSATSCRVFQTCIGKPFDLFPLPLDTTSRQEVDLSAIRQVSVSAPSTLVIFALGLVGIAARRIKKLY